MSHRTVVEALLDGIAAEGVPARLVQVRETADCAFIGHAAARLSGSGVAIGIQSGGTAVIHQRDLAPLERDSVRLPSGRPIEDFSVENLEAGRLGPEDLGIHEETLRQQARLAEEAGFGPLARNLERAAELTRGPAAKILEIYEALRRGTGGSDLDALAREVEETYGAKTTAAFIREAAGLTRA